MKKFSFLLTFLFGLSAFSVTSVEKNNMKKMLNQGSIQEYECEYIMAPGCMKRAWLVYYDVLGECEEFLFDLVDCPEEAGNAALSTYLNCVITLGGIPESHITAEYFNSSQFSNPNPN